MKAETHKQRILLLALATGLVLPAVHAAEAPATAAESRKPALGAITGIVKSAANAPLAGATITASRMDGGAIRATVSGSDGLYSFADMSPGPWSITMQVEGYPDSTPVTVEVVAGRAARTDILLKEPVIVSSLTPAPGSPASVDGSPDAATKSTGTKLASVAPADQPAQLDSASKPSSDTVWRRWATGDHVGLRGIDQMYKDKATSRQEQPTASLAPPPATAFNRPADAATPEPGASAAAPQTTDSIAPLSPVVPAASAAVVPASAAEKPAATIPKALQQPESTPGVDNETPFAFGDFTWLNGTSRNKDTVLETEFFTPEVRFDTNYVQDFNQPKDHTMGGSTEEFRSAEVQIEQASVGGDFHWQNVRGRILFMFGMFSTTTPRNDASSATGSSAGNTGGIGQWDLQNAYKYVSEAYGGYHFNVNHGLNIDAGIFVSYIGLFSYYNFDNWTYQPSYVSSNTPWFFNGARVQWFPTNKLKIEPWFINGWQSYAKYNGHPGLGGQILWMPKEWLKVVGNQYGYGEDNIGLPKTQRIHTDESIEVRYYNNPNNGGGISKMAFSLTVDAGCQYGGGISCHGGPNKSSFLGGTLYDRIWWHHDMFAVTLGGGLMNNTGRYLTLLPPIDGAWAASGSVYFTENPGQPAHMWDSTVTFHYMPRQYVTWWAEVGYRHSDVPYFSGRGGITPPGGNNGLPPYYTCTNGASAMTADLTAAQLACGVGNVWFPDLRRSTSSLGFGVMVKF